MKYQKGSVRIEAKEIKIGEKVRFGENIDIKVNGVFEIGDFSRLGDNVKIRGNSIHFGEHLYHSSGLVIGGGGNQGERANLTVGDRCVLHNNFINVCEPIIIGNDVGLSPDVSILTHGFWGNVLEGHPRKFASVEIYDNVIVGYRSTILPGVTIGYNAVIGACSVVSKDVLTNHIYAGNPARLIREIEEPRKKEKKLMLKEIAQELGCFSDYPFIYTDEFSVDTSNMTWVGRQSKKSDKFRDELRKYGIRIYTERPF